MDDERVKSFERDLWIGGEDVYRERIAEDCLMVVPAKPFLLAGSEAVAAVSDTPRWSDVEFSEFRISRPQEGIIVIAYKADAQRGEETYQAYCTSTYQRLGHDQWQVVQHQQTVALSR
jgi:hypothetical protein